MYSQPNRIKYVFDTDISGLSTGGAGVIAEYAVRGPKGKIGVLYDYGFEGVTTVVSSHAADIAVGTTADPDAYGNEFAFTNLAAEDAASVRNSYRPKGTVLAGTAASTDISDFIFDGYIPANQKVLITVQAASTDATGIGTAFAIIDWAD